MSKIDDSVRFYRKMSDLQEKLRRSEEERLQLEEKFALLMRACRDEEEIRLNMLREKYEKFLEEEKIRKERNERILLTLERIESRSNMLTAKSERLRLLRRHYEAYLMRMYPRWKYITDKSKAAMDQDSLTNSRYGVDGKISPASFHPMERELHSGTLLPQYNHYSNLTLPTGHQPPSPEGRTISSAPVRPLSTSMGISTLPTLNDAAAKYEREVKVNDSTSPGQIPIIKTQGSVLPERTSAERPIISGANTQILSGAERTTELLSIKPDHRHPLKSYLNDVKQTEQQRREYTNSEQEQNTSGDLLNVSLSDDGILQEEAEHTKNENMTSHNEDTHEKRRALAGGDVLQMNSKTSQQIAAIPLSRQLGAGDFGQQRTKVYPHYQNTEPEKRVHQVQGQTQIKQYNQENRQNSQQYISEQHLQPYDAVSQDQILELQKQNKGEQSQSVENQLVMQGQIYPVPEGHMNEQNAETRNYTNEYQKQFVQSAQSNYNNQYDQQQERQYSQLYDQEYPAQFDQHYSEEGQLNEQYNLQYPDQSQMDQQYNLQYSEQDQVNQQYFEQYPEESEIIEQYDQHYDQHYGEQNEIDQQYAEQIELDQQYQLDQQYLEQTPDDQLYQEQYNQQDQFNQDSSQYVAEYSENQQAYPEEVDAIHAYDEQQYDDGRQHVDNQQQSATAPSDEQQKYEQNVAIQEQTSVQQNLQVEQREEYSENVEPEHPTEQLQQQEELQQPQQLHQTEELHQQQPPPLEEQQLSSLAEPQHEEPKMQNQAETNESQQKDVKEPEEVPDQQTMQSDEHSAATDKQPEAGIEEYRRLLGETGEVETSETDELEAQLAELVEPKADGAKEVKKISQQPKVTIDKPVSKEANPVTEAGNIDNISSSDTGDNVAPLNQEASAPKLTVETLSAPEKQLQLKEEIITPVSKTRPASKRLPVLNKVLESDSESLQLDATVSNAESDDFDFSSEQ